MILVLIEQDGQRVKRSSLAAIELARRLGGEFSLAILGHGLEAMAQSLQGYGARSVLVMDDAALAEPLADRYAHGVVQLARTVDARFVIGVSSTFTKDVLPRAAALLDAGMLTDVMSVETVNGERHYTRPIQAGSLCATVSLGGGVCGFDGTQHRIPSTRVRCWTESDPICDTGFFGFAPVHAVCFPRGAVLGPPGFG